MHPNSLSRAFTSFPLLLRAILLVSSALTACATQRPAVPSPSPTPLQESSSTSAAAQPPAAATGPASAHPAFAVQVYPGDGAPLILIPGLSSSAAVWDSTVARYKGKHQLHVLTLAGFAGEPPIGGALVDSARVQLARYIREQKLKDAIVIGHSLGGMLSFWLAETDPELIAGVVSVDGVPFYSALVNPQATAEAMKPYAAQMAAGMANAPHEQFVSQSKQALAQMITAPADQDRALEWAKTSDQRTVGAAMAELMSTDLRPAEARIKARVLLIGATGGFPPAAQEQVRSVYEQQIAQIPVHELKVATHSRHFVMYDDPAFLFAALDNFLAGSK